MRRSAMQASKSSATPFASSRAVGAAAAALRARETGLDRLDDAGSAYFVFDGASDTIYRDDDLGPNGFTVLAATAGRSVAVGDIEIVSA